MRRVLETLSLKISDHTCIQELLISEAQCSNCTSWMMEAAEVRTSRKIDFPKNGGQRPSNKKKPWQYCRPRCGWQTLWAPLRSVPGDQVSVSPWRSDKPLFQELQPFSEIMKTFWNLQTIRFSQDDLLPHVTGGFRGRAITVGSLEYDPWMKFVRFKEHFWLYYQRPPSILLPSIIET